MLLELVRRTAQVDLPRATGAPCVTNRTGSLPPVPAHGQIHLVYGRRCRPISCLLKIPLFGRYAGRRAQECERLC